VKNKKKALIALPLVLMGLVVWHLQAEPDPAKGPLAPLKLAAGDVHYTRLVIAGAKLEKGIYDPSVSYTPDGSVGWMAYSSVTGNGNLINGKVSLGEYVSTHLARTTDGGASWTFIKALNKSTDGTCEMADGKKLQGVWRYEVSSLVCDPTDPDVNRRWKLLVHRYFWERDHESRQTHAWIVLRTAADPAGEWSDEIPLFGAGRNPPAPYHKTKVDVNALDASLKNTVVYTEPGALVHDGKLYVSLTALHPRLGLGGISIGYNIILLVSADHGVSWKFVGTPLTSEDARHFGYAYFDGSALSVEDGKVYLFAVPGSKKQMHDGCVVFEFKSLQQGQLKRDDTGQPELANYIAPQPGILSGPGAGQATYDEHNTSGGIIMPQFNLKDYPDVFQIYQTKRRPSAGGKSGRKP
jgi:hypothetical protein